MLPIVKPMGDYDRDITGGFFPRPASAELPPGVFDARHLPGKHNQKDHGHGHAAAGRVQGRDLTDELDYDAADQQVQDWAIEGRYGDGALGHILAKQGFDGLPESGSREDIDRLVADGHQELFRGWKDRPQQSAGEMQEQFRTGRMDPGYGVFGNGVYTAPNRSEAELYGSTQRMALHKDAKVADYKSVIEEMSNRDDFDDSYSKSQVLQDPGRYAAAKGYDAIRYREEYEPGDVYEEIVILNRTALTVQKGADLQNLDARHLPGKHNQKDHGHGGSVPYDAIMPGRRPPTEAESKAAARAVTATPEGKRLRRTTVAFQAKSGEVERIQQDFMTRAARKSTGDAERDKDMDTLTSAIHHAPPSSQPLYRGFSLDKDVDVHQWVGKSQILPPSSFSSDKALAKSFKGATLKQGRRQAVVTLSPTNRRALPIEKYGTPKYAYEREWLTAGEFKVTKVQQVRGHWQIEMEHTGVFQEAS